MLEALPVSSSLKVKDIPYVVTLRYRRQRYYVYAYPSKPNSGMVSSNLANRSIFLTSSRIKNTLLKASELNFVISFYVILHAVKTSNVGVMTLKSN